MTDAEFIQETNRIEKFYEKELNSVQVQIWYENVRELDISRYRQIVNAILKKCKFMPKLADIIETQKTLPYIQETQTKVYCSKCNGTGLIEYYKPIPNGNKINYYSYLCSCDCANAHEYKGWEIKDKEHRSNFYIPKASELVFEDKGENNGKCKHRITGGKNVLSYLCEITKRIIDLESCKRCKINVEDKWV